MPIFPILATRRAWLALSALLALTAGCGGGSDSLPTAPSIPPPLGIPYSQTDLRVGTGPAAATGNDLIVHYAGWLYSTTAADQKGTLFDTSVAPGRGPYPFRLGARQVIAGWDQGIVGMQVGGVRRLVLPPELGYGTQGNPPAIPPNATLIFEVELLQIQ